MNFIVRTIRSFPSFFFSLSFFFFFSLLFFPFVVHFYISRSHKKDARRTKEENIIENHEPSSHTSFRPRYRDAKENLWNLFATGSLLMKNIFMFFLPRIFFFFLLSLFFSLPSCLGQDKLSLEEYISEISLKG